MLKLAWPATLQQLLIALVFVVDRLVVARCGEAELASLHVSTTVTWTLTSLISALSVASLASIGKLIGAGRRDRAGGTAWLSLGIALGLGAAAGIALWATASTIATAFSLEPAVAHQVVAYLEVMAPFIPAAFFHSAAAACLHGAGDTRTPLSAGALATLVNVLLSMALAFGWGPLPALGGIV